MINKDTAKVRDRESGRERESNILLAHMCIQRFKQPSTSKHKYKTKQKINNSHNTATIKHTQIFSNIII